MILPENLKSEIKRLTGVAIHREKWLASNHGAQFYFIETLTSDQYFLKYRPSPSNHLHREVESLACINSSKTCGTPQVLAVTPTFLLMEYIDSKMPEREYWPIFGRLLANMHLCTASKFGFKQDNYCGATLQPNPWTDDGHRFFIQHRLLYQAKLAQKRSLLTLKDVQALKHLCSQLKELIPEQKAVLLHGDLWSGNHLCDRNNLPFLIDPACYYGWAEAELAMTLLFGGFPDEFYDAYLEVNPLEKGWRDRAPLYNLYHLLNHLNLFGKGYYFQVVSTLRNYQ